MGACLVLLLRLCLGRLFECRGILGGFCEGQGLAFFFLEMSSVWLWFLLFFWWCFVLLLRGGDLGDSREMVFFFFFFAKNI
jgi:hypothetical protein